MSGAASILRKPATTTLLSLVAVGLLLEAAIRAGLVNRFAMPLPSSIIAAYGGLFRNEGILGRLLTTGSLALAASLLIGVIGLLLGILFARRVVLGKAFEPFVAAFAAAPLVLTYPIFLFFFGRTSWALIIFAVVGGIAPVILKTMEGLAEVKPVLKNVGKALQLSPQQMFFKIELPAALPTIFTGIRLGFVFGLIHLVAMEFLLSFGGLGGLVAELAERYNPAATYASVSFVILISIGAFVALERIERWLR